MDASATTPAKVAAAIIAVKKRVKQLGSDEKNDHGNYRYVSVDKFYERIGPMMAEAGLALLIDETETDVRVNETSDRSGQVRKTPWLFARYSIAFMHESGETSAPMQRSLAMPINGPQTYGAAQSYVEKQFLRQVFKIPTGEKDADDTAQDQEPPPRQPTMSRKASEPPRGPAPIPPTEWQEPHALPGSLTSYKPVEWGGQFIAAVRTAKIQAEIDLWEMNNRGILDDIKANFPNAWRSVDGAIAKHRAALGPDPEPEFLGADEAQAALA